MFIEPGSQTIVKLRRSEIFGLAEDSLRSSGAKSLSGKVSYKHLAALRPGHDLWLERSRHHAREPRREAWRNRHEEIGDY